MKSFGFIPKKHNFLKGIRKSEREEGKNSFSRRESEERKEIRGRERERGRKKKIGERKRENHEGKRYTLNEETSSGGNLCSLSFSFPHRIFS